MSYTALYRKYRPQRFSDVLGQRAVVTTLKNQIIGGKISHAYLFCGTRGTGKTSLAKIFAKAINCAMPEEGEPCGRCSLCKDIAGERSLNVIEIDAASNNGVDNIRDLREEVRYTPTEGNYKVYIIDEVHMLSTGAYNALLKTLEEPPEHVIFILATTDPQKIPPTIHSRCQRYDFKRISTIEIKERLLEYLKIEGVEAESEAIGYIARLSDGSMRDALSLLDRCISFYEGEALSLANVQEVTGSADFKCFFELTQALNDMNSNAALNVVGRILAEGKDVSQFILDALYHFRSILICKAANNPSEILDISEENAEELTALSEEMDDMRIMTYIGAFSDLQVNSKYSANQRLLLEIEVIKLTKPEIINNSYEELYSKLLKLEKDMEQGVVVAEKKTEIPVEKKKVALPKEFKLAKEKYKEALGILALKRESQPFAKVLERTKLDFLDDKYIYIIFDDETNEEILKSSSEKQRMLTEAIEEATDLSFSIKTITKSEYETKAKGLKFVEKDSFADSIKKTIKAVNIEVED